MKKHGFILHKLTIAMFVLLAFGTVHAQSEAPVLRVNIPFSFNIGSQKFPAGDYSLKTLSQHTIIVQNQSGESVTNFFTNSVESRQVSDSGKLIFHNYEGRRFLAEMWQPGSSVGQEVIKSTIELELAKASHLEPITLAFATHR
jgi:hypothetical protein